MTSAIQLVTLQSLNDELGAETAIRSCAPITFYMLLRAYGYLDPGLAPAQFVKNMDKSRLTTDFVRPNNWSRPALSQYLRKTYGAPIVSWQFNWNFITPNLDQMKQAGYISSEAETDFYLKTVWSKTVSEIVSEGHPVIVTMEPGFGENKNLHAVIITEWDNDMVTVIEPDARNPHAHFPSERFLAFLSPLGAGSIVLPNPDK